MAGVEFVAMQTILERPRQSAETFSKHLKTFLFFVRGVLIPKAHLKFYDDALYKFVYLLTYLFTSREDQKRKHRSDLE